MCLFTKIPADLLESAQKGHSAEEVKILPVPILGNRSIAEDMEGGRWYFTPSNGIPQHWLQMGPHRTLIMAETVRDGGIGVGSIGCVYYAGVQGSLLAAASKVKSLDFGI